MANLAILVGNTKYDDLPNLKCCHDDLLAVEELLKATEKYEEISIIEDAEADQLKALLRSAVDKVASPAGVLCSFTGHGHQHETDFFHCATNFDSKRPNETGISTTELHTILRLADANLVVKVIDACNSGTLLVKSGSGWVPESKHGFQNLIQISSCLDSQNSLTGNPLSIFTEKFRAAALRKTAGVVFYTDIISTLRDEFIENDTQTPFFVSQQTGREQFVDDATRLEGLRNGLELARTVVSAEAQITLQPAERVPTLIERLASADAKVVKPDLMATFIHGLFENLMSSVSASEFADFFDLEFTEHARFEESITEEFIIRVMSAEKRADNFVTAKHTRKMRALNPMMGGSMFQRYLDEDRYEEEWELRLNCTMARTQLKITLTPKFTSLQRVVLVVTCAPSLDHCYIFEMATQHLLRDFTKYDPDGAEASRRWWKPSWNEPTHGIVANISKKFTEIVREQLESTEKRLATSNNV